VRARRDEAVPRLAPYLRPASAKRPDAETESLTYFRARGHGACAHRQRSVHDPQTVAAAAYVSDAPHMEEGEGGETHIAAGAWYTMFSASDTPGARSPATVCVCTITASVEHLRCVASAPHVAVGPQRGGLTSRSETPRTPHARTLQRAPSLPTTAQHPNQKEQKKTPTLTLINHDRANDPALHPPEGAVAHARARLAEAHAPPDAAREPGRGALQRVEQDLLCVLRGVAVHA
jgi:hypothetical protein